MRVAFLFLILSMAVNAENRVTIAEITTPLQSVAEQFEGFEERAGVSNAVSLAEEGDNIGAWAALRPVLDRCDKLKSTPGYTIASVSTSLEAERMRKIRVRGPPLKFIDIACPSAYAQAGFLFVATRELKKAIEFLDLAAALAPFWAQPYVEKGYLLRVQTDYRGALAAYRHALEISDEFASSAYVKAMALRGVGFTLTEMGDLSGARKAYESSLVIEPNSPNAKHEIEYLDELTAGIAKHPN